MKKNLLLLTLFSFSSYAYEWEGALRENFLTPGTYSYESDSSARIIRDLTDRGYNRISIHPRLSYSGDQKSLFFQPAVKSSLRDLGLFNTRVTQTDGSLTIKPVIYNDPGLGEAHPLDNLSPIKPQVALTSYSQVMAQFVQLSRDRSVSRLVVGSGIAHLLEDSKNIPRFNSMLLGIKKTLGPKTELLFEVVGSRDIRALKFAVDNGFNIMSSVDGLSVVLEPKIHFPEGRSDLNAIKETLMALDTILPAMPVHLSRIVIPACQKLTIEGSEYYCLNGKVDQTEQLVRFLKLKSDLLVLEQEGLSIKTVEILESTTDFEPSYIDPRYPYYNPNFTDPKVYELPNKPAPVLPPYSVKPRLGKKLACIYFDKLDAFPLIDRVGDIHSVMLESNLGAFKSWSVKRKKITDYIPGEMNLCDAVFYLATNFTQGPPQGFVEEVALESAQIPVVWFNYKSPLLTDALKAIGRDPGFEVPYLIQPDTEPSPTNQDPGFYRFFDYKGETFFKLAEWNPLSNNFSSSPELGFIKIHNHGQVEILAKARHSKSNKSLPYAVRSGNIWYFGDSPLSFAHYEDRYYILADLLWDITGEEAPTEKLALARFEDIAPNINVNSLRWAIDYMADQGAPFSMAVIPFYTDMVGMDDEESIVHQPITKYPGLVQAIRYATIRGGSLIMHGTAHAVGKLISGYDGYSGSDYEFWLYPENTPLPFDSVDWFTRRVERGIEVFNQMGLKPAAFEVPHYAASVMNYLVLGKMFRWNYHRTVYFPFEITSNTGLPEHLEAFNCKPTNCGEERRAILNNIKVNADYTSFGGMAIPYIVYRDAYEQALIPETLGMIDFAFYAPDTWRPVNKPEDVIRRAKKLRVIRGAIASFFWHPQLLERNARYYREVPGSYEQIGGKKSLTLVVEGLKKLGYTFISIDDKKYFPDEIYQ